MIHLADDSGGGAAAFLILLGVAAYFLPTICALVRKVPNRGSVIIINIFLGWTFIGWVVALAMAFRSQNPSVNVNIQNQQPAGYPQPQAGYQQPPQQPGGYQPQGPGQPPAGPPHGTP